MSSTPTPPPTPPTTPPTTLPANGPAGTPDGTSRGTSGSRKGLIAALVGAGILLLAAILVGGLYWYVHTPQFAERMRAAVIRELEHSTGGRVDLSAFHLDLLHLGFEADNLTIHGKEGPGELPYAHLDRLIVHLKIINLLGAKIGLSYLGAERPIFHLIIYPDGSTNAPTPSTPSRGLQSTVNQIFDLAINQTQLNHGLLVINQERIPFNLAARNLSAQVSYNPTRRDYQAHIEVHDLELERSRAKAVHSKLMMTINAWRNHLSLTHFELDGGGSRLLLTGSLLNYAHPDLALKANGELDLRVLAALAGVEGFRHGQLRVEAAGQGTADKFTASGKLELKDLIYKTEYMHTDGISATTRFLVTQDRIAATDFRAWLKRGGSFRGQMLLTNWRTGTKKSRGYSKNGAQSKSVGQSEAESQSKAESRSENAAESKTGNNHEAKRAPQQPEQGKIEVEVESLPLNSLLAVFAPARYQDFGFDTAMTGRAEAHWTGSAKQLEASTSLQLAPTGFDEAGEVPVSGAIVGSYSLARGTAQLDNLTLVTAATHGHAQGGLGINRGLHGSHITVNLTTTDLGEFDRMLAAFELAKPGERTGKLVPINLEGSASFHGTVSGTATDPNVEGHLTAQDLKIEMTSTSHAGTASATHSGMSSAATHSSAEPKTAAHSLTIDSLNAEAQYSPEALSLSHATLLTGSAQIELSGKLTAHRSRRLGVSYDQQSTLSAQAVVTHARLEEILPMLGFNLPVTGTAQASIAVHGTLQDPVALGSLHIAGGTVYGEPYQGLTSQLEMLGRTLALDHLVYEQDGGKMTGSASYNLTDQHYSLKAQGTGFRLDRIHRLQSAKYPIEGLLSFEANGEGTLKAPQVQAQLHVTGLRFAHQEHGTIEGTATTLGHLLKIDATAHLAATGSARAADSITLESTTTLAAPYQTEARLAVQNLDLNPVAAIFHLSAIESHQPLEAVATLNGPLNDVKQLRGQATISPFSLTAEKIDLATSKPIVLTLADKRIHLNPFVVSGPNIHFMAEGSVDLLGKHHWLNLHTNGALNMQLAEVFDRNLNASGDVSFKIDADGTLEHPALNGLAQITNVNLSLENYINGLSRVNGSLVFNEGRVDLKDVTGYSGGGKIALTGFATYAAGFYTDITANAQDVRVRYPAGITSTIDAKIRLQGGVQGMLLSGNAELTRFSVSPNIDLASLVSDSSSLSLPPNPNDFANRIRLDIRITSAPSMDFQNSFAKLAGTVNLQVRGTVEEPSVLGQITITEGEATFADTTYQLQRGVIYFTNPIRIEPVIDLDATTQVENYNITVGVHGSPDHLTPIFRSSPPLSEQDIFSLLALGRTQEEQQIYSEEQAQAGVNSTADAILGSAINATVSNRIQKLFGGGSIKIDPTYVSTTGNATARLTVKQQIAKNITLTYATNVNSNAQQLIQGQWNITPNLSILAVRDESGVFSLVFTLRRQYR